MSLGISIKVNVKNWYIRVNPIYLKAFSNRIDSIKANKETVRFKIVVNRDLITNRSGSIWKIRSNQ